jgi:hypothetical protein
MTQEIRIRGAIEPKFTFLAGASVEVMRIHKNGVTVNPEMALDEAAQHVINALDAHIKNLIQAEREACAKVCDQMEQEAEGTECCKWPTPADCAHAIRARGQA